MLAWLGILLTVVLLLIYWQINLLKSTLILGVLLSVYSIQNFNLFLWLNFALIFLVLNITALRCRILTQPIFKWMQSVLPAISQTEQEAIEAGNTWWDAELFSGNPDWKVLLDLPKAQLSAAEQAFIDGPVETLCAMLDDWDITHHKQDLPVQVWDYIKQQKFFGMIIPKQYGGLEFSHFAHSEVVMKISSRSATAAVTVMVPNSLGPAKLLLSYGTQKQKDYYLPRLASAEEIPCFALTGPQAGSDASAMPDTGVICKGQHNGKDNILGIRLNWEKRYITLAPVATILGLAFKLYDPDHLIGKKENLGITVALIPTDTPGITIGSRHFPLNSAFQNGPNWGKDVFIPMDWVLGGIKQIGNGWKMLMQSLATGRAISLPALSAGAAKFTSRNTGAYARIRKQFKLSLGQFEGVEEVLSRIAGETYIINAARTVTAAALDEGQKPSVISAIIKYELTERMRRVINDGMDIQGGSGICLGAKNYLGRLYQTIPICITVEGANILTRTMIIFGQGAVRCHPFIYQEMQALRMQDKVKSLTQFDRLLFKHIGFIMHNKIASAYLGLSNARFTKAPGNKHTQPYYRAIIRLSAGFALIADYAIIALNGSLKRRERISGRLADVLSHLYLCSAVLKNYQDQACPDADLPLLHWACQQTIYQAQEALFALFALLPYRPVVWGLKMLIFPTGRAYTVASDLLIQQTAAVLLHDTPTRDRLTQGIYINEIENDATGRIEIAFKAILAAMPAEQKIHQAQKNSQLVKGQGGAILKQAVKDKIISKDELVLIEQADQARNLAIMVDDFSAAEMKT